MIIFHYHINLEDFMRTTININDELIKQVVQDTGAKNLSQAVNEVREKFVREKRKQKLFDLKGKLQLEDNWQKLRKMEIDET
jgi:Arc/MetJ family transcription regulator